MCLCRKRLRSWRTSAQNTEIKWLCILAPMMRRRQSLRGSYWRGLRGGWWSLVAFIANRYFFMEVAPWVFPVVGGLVISTHIGEALDWFWACIGAVVVLIGTVPLGIRAYYQEHIQKRQDERDARERACLRIVTNLVPKLPTDDHDSRDARLALRNNSVEEAVRGLVESAYPAQHGYRVTFYELGQDEKRKVQIRPVISRGRGDSPGTHADGSATFDGMFEFLRGSSESTSKAGIERHEYTSYASASVSRGIELYGILAVDTDSEIDLSESDEANLVPIADVLAGFYAAVERGKRQRKQSILSWGMYSMRNALKKIRGWWS